MSQLTTKLLFFLGLILLCVACESEYSRTVKKELNSGVVYDDLILGLKMGQTQKAFYEHCWQLNKQKVISHGAGNKYAKHYMNLDSTAEISQEIKVLFYGIFDKDKVMYGMDMKMSYVAWAPWNKDFHAPKLMEKLQKKYMTENGGNPFIKIPIKDKLEAFAKVDGNRQILMYPINNQEVAVKIEDLRSRPEYTKEIK